MIDTVKTVELQTIHLAIQHAVDEHIAARHRVTVERDISGYIIAQIDMYLAGKSHETTEEISRETIRWPASWWQHCKQALYGSAVLRPFVEFVTRLRALWPVRESSKTVYVKRVTTTKVCPHVAIPGNGWQHVAYLSEPPDGTEDAKLGYVDALRRIADMGKDGYGFGGYGQVASEIARRALEGKRW